jgi:hypothetical protein
LTLHLGTVVNQGKLQLPPSRSEPQIVAKIPEFALVRHHHLSGISKLKPHRFKFLLAGLSPTCLEQLLQNLSVLLYYPINPPKLLPLPQLNPIEKRTPTRIRTKFLVNSAL